MANVSEFSIVTYLRKPGHWRAAIIPNKRIGECGGGERVRSVVTPDDFASEDRFSLTLVLCQRGCRRCRDGSPVRLIGVAGAMQLK